MSWLLLLVAGALEIIWASNIKHADTLGAWIITIILMVISFVLLIKAYKTIPVASAYTVFVGIGTVGTYFVGIYLGESFSILQLVFLLVLVAGIVGMKLYTKKEVKSSGGEQ